jgi:excisionase family DNA binding protein
VSAHPFDRILSLGEASERSGLSTPRLRQLIDEGRLPAKKVGASWLLLAEDVDLLAESSWRARPGRPTTPFAGNWAFEDRPVAEQQWLIHNTSAVLAKPLEPADGSGFRLAFIDIGGGDARYFDLPTTRDPTEFWRWVLVAVEDWAQRVERARGFRVDRLWPLAPPDASVELATVDPDWPPILTRDQLQTAAPVDLDEARSMLRDDRRRLISWVVPALAARISGRVWRIVDDLLLDGIIEIRGRTDPSQLDGVGVYVCLRAGEVTLGSNFKEGLRRCRCLSGYVVTIENPRPHDYEVARSVGGVWFEPLERLIRSVRDEP